MLVNEINVETNSKRDLFSSNLKFNITYFIFTDVNS